MLKNRQYYFSQDISHKDQKWSQPQSNLAEILGSWKCIGVIC